MKDKRKYFAGDGPKNCQSCGKPLTDTFVDMATKLGWLHGCDECHAKLGYGLGVGIGTRYQRLSNGRWCKIPFKPIRPAKQTVIEFKPNRIKID